MANAFSKEEVVLWGDVCEAFEDALVLSRNVDIESTDSVQMARSGDQVWLPYPYHALSYDGLDQSSNFQDITGLSIPATLSDVKAVPWLADSKELRDSMRTGRFNESARRELNTKINVEIMNVVSNQSSLAVPISTAAGDFDDIALADSIMNEQGVPMEDRCMALSSRSYNGLAGNIPGLNSISQGKADKAFEKAVINNDVAGFKLLKLDYANRIAAAGGGAGLTVDTQAAAANYHVPVSTSTSATGESSNYDNRYQTITISSTSGVVAGDRFTIAGVEAVNHETKNTTGQLKTFVVIQNASATTLIVSPPIVSGQGGTDPELQFKNTSVSESGTAAIVFLNTTAADINPFWLKGSIGFLPGNLDTSELSGADYMAYTSEATGVQLRMTKQWDINTSKTKFRLDTFFGVVNKNPEMNGVLLFGQV